MPKQSRTSTFQRILARFSQLFNLQPGRPAFFAGLRTLIFVGGPVGVGMMLGAVGQSAVAVIAALFVGMVDVGGAYRQKAGAMAATTVGMTAMLLIANLISESIWLILPATFIVMFAVGFSGLFGRTVATVSLSTSLMYVVALAKFASYPTLSTVLEQCALCFAGGMWAITVSLLIWVQRPYTPAIQSVASCYQALSQFARLCQERAASPLDQIDWRNRFLQSQDSVTLALTGTRSVLSKVWSAGKTTSLRGKQLLILTEDAGQIANLMLSLIEPLVLSVDHAEFTPFSHPVQRTLEQLAESLQQISKKLLQAKHSIYLNDLDRETEAIAQQRQTFRTHIGEGRINAQHEDFEALVSIGKVVTRLQTLVEQIHQDAQIAGDLHTGNPGSVAELELVNPEKTARASLMDVVRQNFGFQSTLFRHGLRLALVTTLSELISLAYHVPNGYWMTLTAVVALKPDFGGTTQMTLQRIMGTTLGGLIGIALVILVKQPLLVGACLLLLLMMAIAVRPLSYSLFIMLLTPVIILLLNVMGRGGWEIGIIRVVDSIAGGMLALLGIYLLFPRWEKQQISGQLKRALDANLAYFEAVIAVYTKAEPDVSLRSMNRLHHLAAVENANAATAVQRLMSEPRHIQGEIEPTTTFMLYLRRFFGSVTALAEHRLELDGQYRCLEFKQFTDVVEQALKDLALGLEQGEKPVALPELEDYLEGIHRHIERIHSKRMQEISHASEAKSDSGQAVRANTPIFIGMDRLANEVSGLYDAVNRMHNAELVCSRN